MHLQEAIGIALVERRKKLNISQVDLSKESGVCRRYLSDIENGTRSVSVNVLKSLTDTLDWTLTGLFERVESLVNKTSTDTVIDLSLEHSYSNRDRTKNFGSKALHKHSTKV